MGIKKNWQLSIDWDKVLEEPVRFAPKQTLKHVIYEEVYMESFKYQICYYNQIIRTVISV